MKELFSHFIHSSLNRFGAARVNEMSELILFTGSILLASSCTTVDLGARAGKDIQLVSTDFKKLNGSYANIPADTNTGKPLFCNFLRENSSDHTSHWRNRYCVNVSATNPNTLNLELNDDSITIQKISLKGKYKKGYFKVNRHFVSRSVLGPLAWVLGEHLNYIGLSKKNNLVVFNSGGVGAFFMVAVPVFVAGGSKENNEYSRIN